jgi:hypothetical protein
MAAGAAGYFIPQATKKVKNLMQQRWFNASLKKSMELKVKMAEFKGKINANRVYFMQFHNGKVFLGDHQFHKFHLSAIFEITSSGLSREMQNMQNMPLSMYADLIFKMEKEDLDLILVGDHRGCDITFAEINLEEVKYSLNPAAVLYIKVHNKNDMFIGLLAVYFDDYVTKIKVVSDLEKMEDLDSILVYIRTKI